MPDKNQILAYLRLLKKGARLRTSYLFLGDNPPLIDDIAQLVACRAADSESGPASPQAGRAGEAACLRCWDCQRIKQGNHPDLLTIEPQGVFIKIEQIREARRFLSLTSFCLNKKILIIKGASEFSPAAAAAFLKTLEEPPANSFIMVCALSLQGLLPTIVSRCQKIFLPRRDVGAEPPAGRVELVGRFLQGERIKFANRRQFAGFLWTFALILRDSIARSCKVNNQLLKGSSYEIILPYSDLARSSRLLEEVLKIYSVYNSVNENLALNLIRAQLR